MAGDLQLSGKSPTEQFTRQAGPARGQIGGSPLMYVLSFILLLLLSFSVSAQQEIAILTVRQDNIRKSTKSELLPIAKVEHGRFRATPGVETTDAVACAPTTFGGWNRSGVVYDVLYRGSVIGNATAKNRGRNGYSCSELCVVSADTSLRAQAPGIKSQRRGFSPSGSFDESITQYLAYASGDGRRPYSARMTVSLSTPDRRKLESHLEARLAGKVKGEASHQLRTTSVETFLGSKTGEVNVFISAVEKRPNSTLRMITSIVRREQNGMFVSLFELIEDGDEDRGAAYYEMVDAADFDGDGIAEVLVIYHDYEFHEFQILRRKGPKFEAVHKGPSYGC